MTRALVLSGNLTRARAAAAARELDAVGRRDGPTTVDLGQVAAVDSVGAALLAAAVRRARAGGVPLHAVGMAPGVARTLALFPQPVAAPVPPVRAVGLRRRLAEAAIAVAKEALGALQLIADVAAFTAVDALRRRIAWRRVALEMAAMGSQALGVVGLIAFLVGATVALQSAVQLRQFGANIFIADLIGVSMTRELGPLMAAIVVAGRSGAAVAAELGTMAVTEELTALRAMGVDPVRYLTVPKAIAIGITQPLLAAMGTALAVCGGFVVATTYLDVGPAAFLGRLDEALTVKDALTGLFKSWIFGQLVVLVGTLCGSRTVGGPDAVGRSTTQSVVVAIFAIIVADAALGLAFYFGG